MLAYDPGIGARYDVELTIVSLLCAVLITRRGGCIWRCATFPAGRRSWAASWWAAASPRCTTWACWRSICPGGSAGPSAGCSVDCIRRRVGGACGVHCGQARRLGTERPSPRSLLTLAIVSHHFTAMAAVSVIPDPAKAGSPLSLSPSALSLVVAGVAIFILGCVWSRRSATGAPRTWCGSKRSCSTWPCNPCRKDFVCATPKGRILLCNERYTGIAGKSARLAGRPLVARPAALPEGHR